MCICSLSDGDGSDVWLGEGKETPHFGKEWWMLVAFAEKFQALLGSQSAMDSLAIFLPFCHAGLCPPYPGTS